MGGINTWPGWQCVGLLGEGSFGKVYEIKREEYGKTYSAALKVITIPQNREEIEDAYNEGMDDRSITEYYRGFLENIVNEFALMYELKGHSNIVSYEDHMIIEHKNEVGWDILIRMELLTPLKKWIATHSMQDNDVIKLGSDICRALEVCQKKNIIHRDIKPENIFVNNNGDFKLGDFGIARTIEKTVSNLSKKGTYSYMAPEVYLGKPYGVTADIYSLGTVLYTCLNRNRTPFLPLDMIKFSDRERALSRRMRGENVPEPVHGSENLKAVILRALHFYPEKRYQSPVDFYFALNNGCISDCSISGEINSGCDDELTVNVFSDGDKDSLRTVKKKGVYKVYKEKAIFYKDNSVEESVDSEYIYDSNGNLKKRISYMEKHSLSGILRDYFYCEYIGDKQRNPIECTSYSQDGALVNKIEYEYDQQGNIIKEIFRDKNGEVYSTCFFKYDSDRKLVYKKNSAHRDIETRYEYEVDSDGKILSRISVYRFSKYFDEYAYDGAGNISRIITYTTRGGTMLSVTYYSYMLFNVEDNCNKEDGFWNTRG